MLGDTSVVGWQLMALKSAQMAGLEVNPAAFKGSQKWLDSVVKSKPGGTFAYNPMSPATASMTSVGLLCTQYLGARDAQPSRGHACDGPTARHRARDPTTGITPQVMHNVRGEVGHLESPDAACADRHSGQDGCAAGSWDRPTAPISE